MFDAPEDEYGLTDSGEVQRKHGLWVFSSTRSTLSDADGFYELQWLEPSTDYYRLAGSLYGGNPINLRWVNIRVEVDGLVQGKAQRKAGMEEAKGGRFVEIYFAMQSSLYMGRRHG